jgi:hypothetical protein
MSNIPTIEEFFSSEYQLLTYGYMLNNGETAVEFAKLHVKAALKAAAANAQAIEGWSTGFSGNAASVDKESILNAYPLCNVK